VDKIVYCASSAADKVRERLDGLAIVVEAGDPVDLTRLLADLAGRGLGRLVVEGGTSTHTRFLTVDRTRCTVVAPFFVGDSGRPASWAGEFPWNSYHRANSPRSGRSRTWCCVIRAQRPVRRR
jgi:5-amino-6-(5-phosphoribosylamino)uracil reductase